MTKQENPVEASLLYRAPRVPFDTIDAVALKSTIGRLGNRVSDVRSQPDEFILLICETVQILVVWCDVPFAMDHFRGVSRPVGGEQDAVEVLSLLARHKSSLTVVVHDRADAADGCSTDGQTDLKRMLCQETVGHLLAATGPDLVFWCEDDRLLTAVEAEAALEGDTGQAPSRRSGTAARLRPDAPAMRPYIRPSRPIRVPSRTLRPEEIPAARDAAAIVAQGATGADGIRHPEDPVAPRRPAQAAKKTLRPAHLMAEPHLSQQALEWFAGPAPEPVEEPMPESMRMAALRAFLAHDDSPEPKRMSETAAGRASLYVMSATIGVFALPVGASMLTYNALSGGGSFRATANVMALTGIGVMLSSFGLPSPAAALAGLY